MKSDRAFTAVALAGGRLEADFRAAGYTVPNKAYLPVGGRTMLERVLRALRGSASIGSIRCVTRADDSKAGFLNIGAPLWDMRIEPGDDLMGSVLAGCAGLHADELVMVCATDIPLLTPTAVDAFASRARHAGCDLGYGCVYRAAHELAYPQIRHTWVTLRDGSFCGAGVSVVRAGEVKKLAAVLREFTA
ncbi:MAG: NTP transferase domain-containing protein, partial [Candidatus Eremiobacteraeota bacterium]|nr:NTP transferase domain-containing protein [Candidatus Eremiobacteraeota bacterium]